MKRVIRSLISKEAGIDKCNTSCCKARVVTGATSLVICDAWYYKNLVLVPLKSLLYNFTDFKNVTPACVAFMVTKYVFINSKGLATLFTWQSEQPYCDDHIHFTCMYYQSKKSIMPRYSDGMRVLIRSMLSTQGGKDYGYSDVHPSKRYPRGVDPPGMIRVISYASIS